MKSIAVLMPCYNGMPYVEEAILSVINQTYKKWELFVYDDGSTDGSFEVVTHFSKLDSRIHVISSNSNRGIPAARNILLERVSDHFFAVAWLDSDDFARPGRLEVQLSYLLDNGLDVCGSSVTVVDEASKVLGVRKFPVDHDAILKKISRTNPFAQSTILIRRDAICLVGSYDFNLPRAQDYDYWFRLLDAGLRAGNIVEPLVCFRSHDLQGRTINDRLSISSSIRVRLRYIVRRRFFSFLGVYAIAIYCLVYFCPKNVRQKVSLWWSHFSRS